MNVIEMILNSNNGGAVQEVARKFNLPQDKASAALGELLGPLTKGLQRNISQPTGLDSLVNALRKGNHEQYVDRPDILTQETTVDDGNRILGHIFGSKEVSRQVAGEASQKTGIDASILKKMLPIVATMVMGSMAKKTSGGSGLGGGALDVLTSILGGGSSSSSSSRSSGGGLLGGLLGKLFGR